MCIIKHIKIYFHNLTLVTHSPSLTKFAGQINNTNAQWINKSNILWTLSNFGTLSLIFPPGILISTFLLVQIIQFWLINTPNFYPLHRQKDTLILHHYVTGLCLHYGCSGCNNNKSHVLFLYFISNLLK